MPLGCPTVPLGCPTVPLGCPTVRAQLHAWSPEAGMVSFAGELDHVAAPVMAEVFTQYTTPDQDIVVDLSEVTLLSAAAVGRLRHAGALAALNWARLVLVVPEGIIARTLLACGPVPGTTVVNSVAAALAAIGAPPQEELPPPRAIDIRGMRSRIFITEALRTLTDRYSLPDTNTGFELLRAASQHHNVALRTLAGAVLDTRPPSGPTWFPARIRLPAPPLPFRSPSTPRAVLAAALDVVLADTPAPHGAAASADPFHAGLVLTHQQGLTTAVTDLLVAARGHTAGSLALQARRRVVITDATHDPRLDPDLRRALRNAGTHAIHSMPLLAPDGRCLAVLASHHPHPADLPRGTTVDHLVRLATETARWLDWYHRTIVFDALEDLHRRGRSRSHRHHRGGGRPTTRSRPAANRERAAEHLLRA